jgi:hypothetical protein
MERNLCKNTIFPKTKSKLNIVGYFEFIINLPGRISKEYRATYYFKYFWGGNKFEVIKSYPSFIIKIPSIDINDLSELG